MTFISVSLLLQISKKILIVCYFSLGNAKNERPRVECRTTGPANAPRPPKLARLLTASTFKGNLILLDQALAKRPNNDQSMVDPEPVRDDLHFTDAVGDKRHPRSPRGLFPRL